MKTETIAGQLRTTRILLALLPFYFTVSLFPGDRPRVFFFRASLLRFLRRLAPGLLIEWRCFRPWSAAGDCTTASTAAFMLDDSEAASLSQ